jgi:hypothetical protein
MMMEVVQREILKDEYGKPLRDDEGYIIYGEPLRDAYGQLIPIQSEVIVVGKDPSWGLLEETTGETSAPYPVEMPSITPEQSKMVDDILQKQWASIVPGSITSEEGTGYGALEAFQSSRPPKVVSEILKKDTRDIDFIGTGVPLTIEQLSNMPELDRYAVLMDIQSRYGISPADFMLMNRAAQNKTLGIRGAPLVKII